MFGAEKQQFEEHTCYQPSGKKRCNNYTPKYISNMGMTIQEIYDLAVKRGKENDVRSAENIERHLERAKEQYENTPDKHKELFDRERLSNPYSDTRILVGDPQQEVRKIMAGIDVGGDELLLADKMGDVDMAMSHHPHGIALAGLDDVMQLQVDLLHKYGVPVNVAEKLLHKRISEVSRSLSPGNLNRGVDIASHLEQPLMTNHTPTDNLVARFLERTIVEEADPFTVGDIMDVLKDIPEYRHASQIGLGPRLFVGNKKHRAGRIAITEVTGGTEGNPEIYKALAQAGVGTVISMHQSEQHRKQAEESHVNVLVAGHMSSDSLGLNLFLDELEKEGIEIVPVGGFLRVSRN